MIEQGERFGFLFELKESDRYCQYDAFTSTTKYEIKSRRCKTTTYDTTMVPVHKV